MCLTAHSWQFLSSMDQERTEYRVGVFQRSPGARLTKATEGSSGYDIASAEDADVVIQPGSTALVRTGICVELPAGLEAQVRSRSGLAARSGVFVLNSPGTVDSDYRGEVNIVLANFGSEPFVVSPGDRIAQLVFMEVPSVRLVIVDKLSATERGSNGFGSSGV